MPVPRRLNQLRTLLDSSTRPSRMIPKSHLSIRVAPDDLEQITQRAHDHKLTRTAYMILASLGKLPDPDEQANAERLDAHEERLQLLEAATF